MNSRLDNIQAAILDFKLKNLDKEISRRREIASRYHSRLGTITELVLPPAPDASPDHFDVYQNYEVEAERRDELRAYLETSGVRTIIQWGGTPVHHCTDLGFKSKPPYTEKMFQRCFLLPMNTTLSNDDVEYICDKVHAFYGTRG
jgi:dTDP-4-amino-4,6-dideoxygalactose transaminase